MNLEEEILGGLARQKWMHYLGHHGVMFTREICVHQTYHGLIKISPNGMFTNNTSFDEVFMGISGKGVVNVKGELRDISYARYVFIPKNQQYEVHNYGDHDLCFSYVKITPVNV